MDNVAEQAASFGRVSSAYQVFQEMQGKYRAAGEGATAEELRALHEEGAEKALHTAKALGGVYNKAAQFVSSLQGGAGDRGLPQQYVRRLAELTDQAQVRPFEEVQDVICSELSLNSFDEMFRSVDKQPVGAASLAQVHRATMLDGTEVALKVQHKNLQQQAEADLSVLDSMASQVQPAGFPDMRWLLQEFRENIREELDFTREAENATLLTEEFNGSSSLDDEVHVPYVYRSTKRLLVLEFLEPLVHVSDTNQLKSRKLPVAQIADCMALAIFRMTLLRGATHGDPHGGNVYCRTLQNPRHHNRRRHFWQLILLDFGLVYRIDDSTRSRLCELVLVCVWQRQARIEELAKSLAGERLWQFLPLLLSPYFVYGAKLSREEINAAASQRLPPEVSLNSIASLLQSVHGTGGRHGILPVLHCFGYLRGMLNSTNAYSERKRVRALSFAAWAGFYQREPSLFRRTILSAEVEWLHLRIALTAACSPVLFRRMPQRPQRQVAAAVAGLAGVALVGGALTHQLSPVLLKH
jgi:aarF domain-containing kinase